MQDLELPARRLEIFCLSHSCVVSQVNLACSNRLLTHQKYQADRSMSRVPMQLWLYL